MARQEYALMRFVAQKFCAPMARKPRMEFEVVSRLTILSESNTNASAISAYLAFAVELLNEPARLQLIDEAQIDEILRLGICGLGIKASLNLQRVL